MLEASIRPCDPHSNEQEANFVAIRPILMQLGIDHFRVKTLTAVLGCAKRCVCGNASIGDIDPNECSSVVLRYLSYTLPVQNGDATLR